jgi:hypothetical protein
MPRQTGQAERRRHLRVPARIPFHLLTGGKDEPFDLVDLSESGVRIRSPRALAPMTRVDVRVILPAKRVGSKADVSLGTSGVVVWSHKLSAKELAGAVAAEKATPFDVGVFFADLDDRQRNLLRAFIGTHA